MVDVSRERITGFTPEQAKRLQRGWIGEVKYGFWTADDIPPGWLLMDGNYFGSADSGALYTSSEYWELFRLLWTNTDDTRLPIQTSVGGASTRGASAIADWRANKRLQLPSHAGRAPLAKPGVDGSGTGSYLGENVGGLNHTHDTKAHYHSVGAGASLTTGTESNYHTHVWTTAGGTFAVAAGAARFVYDAQGSSNLSTGNNDNLHTHSVTGTVGTVTGGVNGNNDQATDSGNGPTITVYAIIAY